MTDVEAQLAGWTEEALELRHGEADDPLGRVRLPDYELGEHAFVDMLGRVRQRLDRVEELQSMARRAKGRVMRMRENAEFEASLKYDQAIATQDSRHRQYALGDEKRADAALASLTEKREAHRLKRVESFASEALDVIGQCYWGLEKLREDILQLLKIQRFITAEELQT